MCACMRILYLSALVWTHMQHQTLKYICVGWLDCVAAFMSPLCVSRTVGCTFSGIWLNSDYPQCLIMSTKIEGFISSTVLPFLPSISWHHLFSSVSMTLHVCSLLWRTFFYWLSACFPSIIPPSLSLSLSLCLVGVKTGLIDYKDYISYQTCTVLHALPCSLSF